MTNRAGTNRENYFLLSILPCSVCVWHLRPRERSGTVLRRRSSAGRPFHLLKGHRSRFVLGVPWCNMNELITLHLTQPQAHPDPRLSPYPSPGSHCNRQFIQQLVQSGAKRTRGEEIWEIWMTSRTTARDMMTLTASSWVVTTKRP